MRVVQTLNTKEFNKDQITNHFAGLAINQSTYRSALCQVCASWRKYQNWLKEQSKSQLAKHYKRKPHSPSALLAMLSTSRRRRFVSADVSEAVALDVASSSNKDSAVSLGRRFRLACWRAIIVRFACSMQNLLHNKMAHALFCLQALCFQHCSFLYRCFSTVSLAVFISL